MQFSMIAVLAAAAAGVANGAAMPTAAAAAAAAAAASKPSPPLIRSYDMQFENQSALEAAPVPGPVDGLDWKTSAPRFCGQDCIVNPYSYPFDVAFSPSSPAVVSADYPGSKVAFLDLHSFASGCGANQSYPPGASGHYLTLVINCTIAVEGWAGPAAAGKPVASTTVSYRAHPTQARVGVPQGNAELFHLPPAFSGLRNVRFTPSLSNDSVPSYGDFFAVLDDVSYRTTNYTA